MVKVTKGLDTNGLYFSLNVKKYLNRKSNDKRTNKNVQLIKICKFVNLYFSHTYLVCLWRRLQRITEFVTENVLLA